MRGYEIIKVMGMDCVCKKNDEESTAYVPIYLTDEAEELECFVVAIIQNSSMYALGSVLWSWDT